VYTAAPPTGTLPATTGPAGAPAPTTQDLAPATRTGLDFGGPNYGGPADCPTCGAGLCDDCSQCYPYRFWGGVEYILWRIKDTGVPSLSVSSGAGFLFLPVNNTIISTNATGAVSNVTQVNQVVTLPASFTVNSNQGGNNTVSFGDQPGMRFNVGYWLDSEQCFGIDASYFHQWRRTNNFFNTGSTSNIGIPTSFADTQLIQTLTTVNGVTAAQAQPSIPPVPIFVSAAESNILTGSISNQVWGTEFNARCRVCCFGCMKIDAIGGVRYLDLDEQLQTLQTVNLVATPQASLTPPGGTTGNPPVTNGNAASAIPAGAFTFNNAVPLPTSASFAGNIFDLINVRNRFYGAQVGFDYDWRVIGNVFITGFTKIALGDMHETFFLQGQTMSIFTGTTTAGGEFVGPQYNMKRFNFDRVCLMPEVDLNLGYELTRNVRVYVGYDYLYMSALARPVEQLTVAQSSTALSFGNAAGLSGAQPQTIPVFAPAFKPHNNQAWMYGINMGVDFRY
jgi:hypothetical protein